MKSKAFEDIDKEVMRARKLASIGLQARNIAQALDELYRLGVTVRFVDDNICINSDSFPNFMLSSEGELLDMQR